MEINSYLEHSFVPQWWFQVQDSLKTIDYLIQYGFLIVDLKKITVQAKKTEYGSFYSAVLFVLTMMFSFKLL